MIRPLLHDCQSLNSFPGFVSDLCYVYSGLCHCFNQLTVATTQNALGVSNWLHGEASVYLLLSANTSQLIERFSNYFRFLSNSVIGGFFDSVHKDTLDRIGRKRAGLYAIIGGGVDDALSDLMINAMAFPLEELKTYARVIDTISTIVESRGYTDNPQTPSELGSNLVMSVLTQLNDAVSKLERMKLEYETTRRFWKDSLNIKYRKSLCSPTRRLLLTSKEVAIWTVGSVTQPMIFLFSDVLVIWTQMSLQEYPLQLIWISEYSDAKKFTIQLPEETVTFAFPSVAERDHWSKSIISAVGRLIKSAETPDRLPSTRSAPYTFKSGRLRGCQYAGDWYNGQMQGQGLITNPDNTKKYVGEFWENDRHGWGVYICTSPRANEITSYKGYYKCDLQEGLGEAQYSDGSLYKGFWKCGTRNGHGVMFYQHQPGIVYMGNWQDDKRQG